MYKKFFTFILLISALNSRAALEVDCTGKSDRNNAEVTLKSAGEGESFLVTIGIKGIKPIKLDASSGAYLDYSDEKQAHNFKGDFVEFKGKYKLELKDKEQGESKLKLFFVRAGKQSFTLNCTVEGEIGIGGSLDDEEEVDFDEDDDWGSDL